MSLKIPESFFRVWYHVLSCSMEQVAEKKINELLVE
jgi:hypothetical protein